MEKKWRFDVSYMLLAWIVALPLQQWWNEAQTTEVALVREPATGAADDFLRATQIARAIE